jgi:hypothetical protein
VSENERLEFNVQWTRPGDNSPSSYAWPTMLEALEWAYARIRQDAAPNIRIADGDGATVLDDAAIRARMKAEGK